MNSYSTIHLLIPTLTILIIGFFVSWSILKDYRLAITISLIKTLIFFIYFNWIYDGSFNFIDDIRYLKTANSVLLENRSIIDIFYLPKEELWSLFQSTHYLYFVYNMLAIKLFGYYYFSPVVLNIILTFFSGILVFKIFFALTNSLSVSKLFFIFFELHWDIVTWSTIINMKGTVVLFLTSLILYYLIQIEYFKRKRVKSLIIILLSSLILTTVRYYIPILLILSYIVLQVVYGKIKLGHILVYGSVLIVLTFFLWDKIVENVEEFLIVSNKRFNTLLGSVRFLLTPLPFKLRSRYEFQLISSSLHLITIPLTFLGIIFSYFNKKGPLGLLIVYFVVVCLFYGAFDELQGPRHRYQISYIIAMFQFLGIYSLLRGKIILFGKW